MRYLTGASPIIERGQTAISVADAHHVAKTLLRTAYIPNITYVRHHKVSRIFYVFRCRTWYVIFLREQYTTPTRAKCELRIDNGDANFARRRFSSRSFSMLLSTFIGSDKPFKSARGG